MVGYIQKSTGGDFAPTPEGQHTMICSRVIDLGTQESNWQDQIKKQRKIAISWELPEVQIEIEGKQVPVLHTERFTWSFHEKSNLRKILEQWRGVRFVDSDFIQGDGGFHIESILGAPCMAQIVHEHKNEKTYANLSTLMKSQLPKEQWPAIQGERIFYDLDNPDESTFNKLGDYWRGLIMKSPEWMMHGGHTQSQSNSQIQNDQHVPDSAYANF